MSHHHHHGHGHGYGHGHGHGYGPSGAHGCCCSGAGAPPIGYLALVAVPPGAGGAPAPCPPLEGGCAGTLVVSPYELSVAPEGEAGEALVGGTGPARLTLEYLAADGAEAASITLSVEADGSTSTWEEASPAPGYQVKRDLMSVNPGTRLRLEVTDAMARLRWCETLCC